MSFLDTSVDGKYTVIEALLCFNANWCKNIPGGSIQEVIGTELKTKDIIIVLNFMAFCLKNLKHTTGIFSSLFVFILATLILRYQPEKNVSVNFFQQEVSN